MAWRFKGPDRANYRLRFVPPFAVTDAPDLHTPNMAVDEPDINMPMETSVVTVTHFPGNRTTALPGDFIAFDQWDVVGTNPSPDLAPDGQEVVQLGTLHKSPKKPSDPPLHVGQYSMKLHLEALGCF